MDDESKLLRILDLLPETFVDDFVNYHLYNAFYPWSYINTLDRFKAAKSEVMFEFHDRKTNKEFQTLKEKFDHLNEFLLTHFSIPNAHYQTHQDTPFLYLEPRIHHNFRLSDGGHHGDATSDSLEWDRLKSELDELSNDFLNAYRAFLRIGSFRVGKRESVWSKFFTWVFEHITQILIGVVVAGIAFLLHLK